MDDFNSSLYVTGFSRPLTCRYLVDVGCVKPLCDLLTVQDPRMVMITLEGLENILKIGQQDAVKNVNPFALMVEEAYGVCVCVSVEYSLKHANGQP